LFEVLVLVDALILNIQGMNNRNFKISVTVETSVSKEFEKGKS